MFRTIGVLLTLGFAGLLAAGRANARPELHAKRLASSDLEVSGTVRGVPPGESRFVSREFLAGLPQVEVTIQEIEELRQVPQTGLRVKGIYVDVLAQLLGADMAIAAAAVCSDGYTSTLSMEYIKKHRPLFVLAIEGMTPHDWAVKNNRFDAGPYFIGYESFVPSFKVLGHAERPQEPDGVTKMVFDTEDHLIGRIAPKRVPGSKNAAETDGYAIARQNCYRCHNSGAYGGIKAGVSWSEIASIAKNRPKYFAAWVHDPQSIRPRSSMPPNKDYDEVTLAALQRYYAALAVEAQ